MTGWGQDGPMAQPPGTTSTISRMSGVLGAIGRAGREADPADQPGRRFRRRRHDAGVRHGRGLLAVRNGAAQGQVIDCAMTDGSALLMAMMWGFRGNGMWTRGARASICSIPARRYYDTYATADGEYVAIGSIEPQFYAMLREQPGPRRRSRCSTASSIPRNGRRRRND